VRTPAYAVFEHISMVVHTGAKCYGFTAAFPLLRWTNS
jgi:hypothetical protein